MNRRSLIRSLGSAALFSSPQASALAQTSRKTRLYRLQSLHLRQGDQGTRLNQFLTSQMPLLAKHIPTLGIFTEVISPRMPTTVILAGFSSFEEMETADDRIHKDSGYRAAFEQMESGAEPPYDYADQVLLRATDYSPEIVPLKEKPKTARVFELRTYHSPTERQLRLVHERFTSAEIAIFHRSGVHPIFYSDTLIGPDMPNLTYLMPFASLADREKAWDAFGADPEWAKARAESIARGGQIVDRNSFRFLRPAAFSPIQ